MVIFVVIDGECGATHFGEVRGVFSTRELAEAFAVEEDLAVLQFTVDTPKLKLYE